MDQRTVNTDKLTFALIIIGVLTIVGALMYSRPAHSATRIDVTKAIAKTKAAGTHSMATVPLDKGGVFVLDVWEFRPNGCEKNVGVNITIPMDSPTAVTLIAFKPMVVDSKTAAVAFIDMNGDGIVDDVANTTMTVQAAQPMYDAIVECVARQ